MRPSDFTKYAKDDYIYIVVNANRTGYITSPEMYVMGEGNRSYITPAYGHLEFVGFDIASKKRIYVYVRG